ncbi:MAG TPA: TRAM domain-containing protein [Streptosporangiaceae bacterium]|nr:TRAM domain-containing protein [Streptosporangiaceae bacterium]
MTTSATTVPLPGDVLELTVGEAVHGGWCVARPDDRGGRVVFVRHALPGERVRAVLTQITAKLARADAVEILAPSPDRVRPPCPHARPGGCGGCDWQHAGLPAQRRLKAAVIRQQLARIAGLDREVTVEPLGDDTSGLGWRTRVSFAIAPDGTPGLRRHRSHEVVEVGECPIAYPAVNAVGVTAGRWPGARSVQVAVVPATGERAVLVTGPLRGAVPPVAADSVRSVGRSGARTALAGRGYLTQHAAGRDWRVDLAGFWQVHPAAADTLAQAVAQALAPRPGDRALDLYCGAGLFAGVLARAVGPSGTVIGVESDATAVRDARHNLREWPWARVHRGDAGEVLSRIGLSGATIAVLDPPRAGADRAVIDALTGAPATPLAAPLATPPAPLRTIAYVSCDPATLARDLRLLIAGGWALDGLRAFDAFPMTHHVECLATLTRQQPPPAS